MNVLRGISPRLFSIFCNKDIGNVIPSFSVRSLDAVVLIIPIYLIVLSYNRFLNRENTHSLGPKGSVIASNELIPLHSLSLLVYVYVFEKFGAAHF
jgi:hypothetical protein